MKVRKYKIWVEDTEAFNGYRNSAAVYVTIPQETADAIVNKIYDNLMGWTTK